MSYFERQHFLGHYFLRSSTGQYRDRDEDEFLIEGVAHNPRENNDPHFGYNFAEPGPTTPTIITSLPDLTKTTEIWNSPQSVAISFRAPAVATPKPKPRWP